MEDRITVKARSQSTTQHLLTVCLDGVAMVTVDNSLRGRYPHPGRPFHGDSRDWMNQTVEEATPWLKLWFVQRHLRFSSEAAPEQYFRHRYDGMLAEQIHRDGLLKAAKDHPADEHAHELIERERG
jgi:hypothetical protein